MRYLFVILMFTCAVTTAQVNFVKNPSFEQYTECPDGWNKIYYANSWRNVTDSVMRVGMEYYNECGNAFLNENAHVPENNAFFQMPHSGKGLAGAHFFNDKSIWADEGDLPYNYRDNLQGHLIRPLIAGKTYCVSFWVNSAEAAGYVQNKIGAYLDDGSINAIADTPGEEITSVMPQVYTDKIIEDTMLWEKIEGSFVATGTETHISIGNFFPNSAVATKYPNYWNAFYTTSYYLIDDVSVIPIDLAADAGKDSHAAPGKPVQIGRVGDTTAMGLDCKWYHKGALIDSGAVISVLGSAIVGAVDTYVVVQTICGLVKTDTVTVKTVPVGMKEWGANQSFTVYPNPSNGAFTITCTDVLRSLPAAGRGTVTAAVYDVLGRLVHQQILDFTGGIARLTVTATQGNYILELADEAGNATHQRIVIE